MEGNSITKEEEEAKGYYRSLGVTKDCLKEELDI
jgi:hypothetical protein